MKPVPAFPKEIPLPFFEIHPIIQNRHNSQGLKDIRCGGNECKIVWLKRGTGIYSNGPVTTTIRSNVVFCLSTVQQGICPDQDAEGFVISFSGKLLSMDEIEFDLTWHMNFFKRFSKTDGLPVSCDLDADLAELVARMIKENTHEGAFRIEVLKRYLKIFFIYLTRDSDNAFQPEIQTKMTEHVDRFILILEQNFRTKKMVSYYADSLFVTPNYLNEVIKKTTGHSASHHIRQRIVTEAKKLALSTEQNMKEIAYSLGFMDCAHFSKFFKAVTGNTFSAYKKQKLAIRVTVQVPMMLT